MYFCLYFGRPQPTADFRPEAARRQQSEPRRAGAAVGAGFKRRMGGPTTISTIDTSGRQRTIMFGSTFSGDGSDDGGEAKFLSYVSAREWVRLGGAGRS